MVIDRDLALLGYLNGPAHLHFSKISSAESVEKVRQALAQGLRLSCGVAAHHLASTQEDVEGFRTDFKVYPPLRSSTDRAALMEGILDGTIAVICSDHQPGDSESKDVEFPAAAFGQAGIQHAFLAALEAGSLLDARRRTRWVSRVVHALTEGPERILGIHEQVLDSMDKGQPNGWVVFDPGYSSGAAATKAAQRYSQGVAQAYHNTPFRGSLLAVVGPGRTMVASEL
jgi:dihydroorotase